MKSDNYLFLTDNGFELLESYLKAIYGERGSAAHNLQRYVKGHEYHAGCRYATDIDQLPELTPEQIKAVIERQEMFKKASRDFQKKYDELIVNNALTDEDYLEIAGCMGLCPGRTDWVDTFFPYMVDLFVSSEEEGDKIWADVQSNLNIVKAMVDRMMGFMREEQIVRFENREVLSKGYARYFYRGESAYNGTSKPSIVRKCPVEPETKEMYYIVAVLRIMEFCDWLTSLECVKGWPFGTVYHGAIAQHYGIPTNGVDVTSDLKVALFFACCQYDAAGKKWRPLQQADFEFADSRQRVFARGGDSRYGVLFSAPADICELSRVSSDADIRFTKVEPIGYQPFYRCSYQSGYMIPAAFSYDMYKDATFAKVKFRHTEELCNWIYNEMDQGRKIYPVEEMVGCEAVVEKINKSKMFSKKSLKSAMTYLKISSDRQNEIEQQLADNGYVLEESIEWLPKDEVDKMNAAWLNGNYAERMGINPMYRIGFCL